MTYQKRSTPPPCRGADPEAAHRAAYALYNLLGGHRSLAAWADLPPHPVARALTEGMRTHLRNIKVQENGCRALHSLCWFFPKLRSELRMDNFVGARVRATVQKAAAVEPRLEGDQWYRDLCKWLQPCLGFVADGGGAVVPTENCNVVMFALVTSQLLYKFIQRPFFFTSLCSHSYYLLFFACWTPISFMAS